MAKFANPTIREAGVLSLLFILVSSVFYTIALNAETEEMRVWAFGGTMLVLATVILAFTLLSKFALKKVEDITSLSGDRLWVWVAPSGGDQTIPC